MILRFGCWLVLLVVCCVALANVEVSTDEIELDNNTFADNSSFQSDDCDCGLHTKSCSYVGGKKICICDDLYADYLGKCTACDCNSGKYGCKFNRIFKECKCPKGYVQLHEDCRKCDCGEHGSCKLYDFGKICQCEEGYKLKTSVFNENSGICEECDCGENGGCEFIRGYKKCTCKPGFAENRGKCEDCNCSPGRSCTFKNGFDKECICPTGYANFKGQCKECDCGDNGICTLNEGNKQCDCYHGFSENYLGQCEACDCKMAQSNCTIEGFQKKCQCPKGYEQAKIFGFLNPECIDIDECLRPEDNDCPPISTKCVNTQGSYDCECKEGFIVIYENGYPQDIKEYGCKDIDECLVDSPCINLHTRCVNTPGSYRCECRDGYSLEKDRFGEKYNYCSEYARTWKTASIVMGGLYGIVSLGLLLAICIKHLNKD